MPLKYVTTFSPLPDIEQGTPYVLGADPKGKNFIHCCGKAVIIRDINNPMKCETVSKHASDKVTAAQYSPSGFYICSADITGKIKIWDTTQTEHIIKYEYQPMSGHIKDIVWGPESKRLAVCGDGRQLKASVIFWDSGTTCGNLEFVTKRANSISYRQVRPYRLAIGDDSYETNTLNGVPFKLSKTHSDHTRFVQSVRYSPDGKYLATTGSDHRVFLYDGKDSELIGELKGENGTAHDKGVYAVSWSPNSAELLTVSADHTAKIWNAESRTEVVKFTLNQHQNSCLWMGDHLLSVGLKGQITYLDRANPTTPLKVLEGHAKPLTRITIVPDGHVTGDDTGKLLKWNTETGDAKVFTGAGHTSKITGLIYDACNDEIVTVGWDDKMRFTSATSLDFSASTVISLESQPMHLFKAGDGYYAVHCHKSIVLVKDKKVVFDLPYNRKFQPACIAAIGSNVAIGAEVNEKSVVQIYHIEGDALVKSDVSFDIEPAAFTMSYSPDGSKLAICKDNKYIDIMLVADGYKNIKCLMGHNSKPSVMAWSPNSEFLAAAGTDGELRVWRVAEDRHLSVRRAHESQVIFGMAWVSNETLLTVGNDMLTKQWSFA